MKRVVPPVLNVHRANTNPNTAKKCVVSVMSVHFHHQVLLRFVRHVQKDTTKTKKAGHRVSVAHRVHTKQNKDNKLVKTVSQANIYLPQKKTHVMHVPIALKVNINLNLAVQHVLTAFLVGIKTKKAKGKKRAHLVVQDNIKERRVRLNAKTRQKVK
jgi:hypothetical protein